MGLAEPLTAEEEEETRAEEDRRELQELRDAARRPHAARPVRTARTVWVWVFTDELGAVSTW